MCLVIDKGKGLIELVDSNNGYDARSREVLDFCLQNESAEFKAKVYEIIGRSGLDASDPMFLVLALTGQIRVFLEAAPRELNQLLEKWRNQNASSLSEISAAIFLLKQAQQEQAETIRENMEAVSSKYIAGIKEAGMATTSAIAEANGENWSQSRETKQQIWDLKEEIKAIYAQVQVGQQENTKIMTALIERLSSTTGEFNIAEQKMSRSHSAIKSLQLKTFWLKWAEWLSPLLALAIVGGAGFFAGGWLTYQKYNTPIEKLGRNLIKLNLDRYLKCRDDNNPKCTFLMYKPKPGE